MLINSLFCIVHSADTGRLSILRTAFQLMLLDSLTNQNLFCPYLCLHSLLIFSWIYCSFWFPAVAGVAVGIWEWWLVLHSPNSHRNRINLTVFTWWNSCTNRHPITFRATPATIRQRKEATGKRLVATLFHLTKKRSGLSLAWVAYKIFTRQ
jgi:hypothetical protein